LPQYHPIPENDHWWGKGFTEWVNVASCRPRFRGHCQPHIPADLGFYDLRLEETRMAQAELASRYGIEGFCYYHYWFNGKKLLERPLEEMHISGKPDYPFCICWANENWTRAWDGCDRQILIKQDYTERDSWEHIEYLFNLFKDSRYITVNSFPVMLIYRPDLIPDVSRMISLWNKFVNQNGLPGIYFVAVKNSSVTLSDLDLLSLGFSNVLEFQPNSLYFPSSSSFIQKLYHNAKNYLPNSLYQQIKITVSANKIIDYEQLVNCLIEKSWPKYKKIPCIFPSWDNSARRKTPTIIQNSNPNLFHKWYCFAQNSVQHYKESERFVFINAWNEWAEGCHLEPDKRHGTAFLDAIK